MMKKFKKLSAAVLSSILCMGIIGGGSLTAPAAAASNTPDTSKAVNLVYYLWGSEGIANPDVLAEINKKLQADINATLEIKYIDWSDVATKYPLLFASGENFDLSHASPNAAVSYFTLAADELLVDITDMLDVAAPALKAEIPENVWATTMYDGKIYGVPTLYNEFTTQGFIYRRDLNEKYGIGEIDSIEKMEEYLAAVKENETFPPLNGNSITAQDMYRMFTNLAEGWIEAPGIPNNTPYLVCSSPEEYKDIIHPVFSEEFEDFAVLMRSWSDQEFWPKDILSSTRSAKDNFNENNSGSFISHQPDWTGNYGALELTMPGVETDFWAFPEANNKILKKMGVENSTVVSVTSKNPERALMAIEKFMTEESYYRLIQNGIHGRQYIVKNGKISRPESYKQEVDGSGFAVWSLRTDRFNLPMSTEDPRRYSLNEEWEKVAINNPYVGFSFDSTNVSTELAAISNVNSQIGIQILLGKTTDDPVKAVEQYRDQLTKAGVEKVIEELKKQLENHTPIE